MPAATPIPLAPQVPAGQPAYAASATSGVVPASGESGAYSGPWMIEEQTMDYDYVRVPRIDASAVRWTLSSADWYGDVVGTHFKVRVRANYSVTKTYENYHTSSWVQPQTFNVVAASADPYGNEYGSVSAGTFGPQGSMLTNRKWYYRRFWRDSIDTEVNRVMKESYNYFITDSAAGWLWGPAGQNDAGNGTPQDIQWVNFDHAIPAWLDQTAIGGMRAFRAEGQNSNDPPIIHEGRAWPAYQFIVNPKGGGYTTEQDIALDTWNWTDYIATLITGVSLTKNACLGDPNNLGNKSGFPEYSRYRHSWNTGNG